MELERRPISVLVPVVPVRISEFAIRTLIPTEEEVREVLGLAKGYVEEAEEADGGGHHKKKQQQYRVTWKSVKNKSDNKNASVKRLLSGAFAGAVSRTAVAPIEAIRTHLMVGTGAASITSMVQDILRTDGWQGLFRGNGVNVIRVAPSKAIELFAYDTVKTLLTPKDGEPAKVPFPVSSVAGAVAGFSSTLCVYPLELLKTRLTIQRGVYDNLFHAIVKICKEEGPCALYRGLCPSLIGVMPYAAMNYFAYDSMRKMYKTATKKQEIGHLQTMLMGSIAGVLSSTATFPLEVARRRMQVGALGGRVVYDNVIHVISAILEEQGPAGLYRGLGASWIKLIPAAGISLMCYEACKQILIEEEESNKQY